MKRSEIQAILASAGQTPQHRFGQNFMVDEKILTAIADAGDIAPTDIILEVGPGVGNLTRLLAQRAAAVLAVDIDKKLLPAAQRHHAELKNVSWMNADVLAGKHALNPDVLRALAEMAAKSEKSAAVKLVSNLPYNAASPLIAELLVMMWGARHDERHGKPGGETSVSFERLAFTVQMEVAQRMAAKPNCADYGPLGILIQLMAKVEIVRKIPPGAFWPPPKVNSALVVVKPDIARMERIGDAIALQRMLAGIFSHRRQRLSNGLKHYLGDRYSTELAEHLSSARIDLSLRPEALEPGQFMNIETCISGRVDV